MALLRCRVAKSAMAHERSLIVEGVGKEYESWADSRAVQLLEGEDERSLESSEAQGLVTVRVVDNDATNGLLLVELPEQVIMGGRRVWVPAGSVRE